MTVLPGPSVARHFLPGSAIRRDGRRTEEIPTDELLAAALQEIVQAVDTIWAARIRLGELERRGERVKGAYDAAVKASKACDRALAKAPRGPR